MVGTPAERWKATITKYRKQCQSILKVSKNIRYAGVINDHGRTLTGVIRPGLRPLLKSEQVKNEFFIISTLMSLRKESVSTVGKLEHVILHHHKVTILLIQKKDVTYYVSVNKKEKNLEKTISSIKKTI